MQIGNLLNFSYDRMWMYQDLPYTYEGQIYIQLAATFFTTVNMSDEPGSKVEHCRT